MNMDDSAREALCARLTGTVSTMSAKDVYNKLNLVDTPFSEFHFKDMVAIFHLDGMEQWPSMLKDLRSTKQISNSPPPTCFSLVCFKPPAAVTSSPLSPTDETADERKVRIAHDKAREMLRS